MTLPEPRTKIRMTVKGSDDLIPDPEVAVYYERRDDLIRVKLRGLTNHELRGVLVGLWARLDEADRADHINELLHYEANKPGTFLPPIADVIRKGG